MTACWDRSGGQHENKYFCKVEKKTSRRNNKSGTEVCFYEGPLMEGSWGVEMSMRTQRERGGRVWRGAWDCPWWMGGAVSMRWAGRLWAGPDGLAGLRAAVCALQTVVGETTINTQRLLECLEEKKKPQKRHGDNCAKKKKANSPTSATGLYPEPRRQPALSTLPTTSCHPSGLNCPPTSPPGEPRPPTEHPHLTSVAIKRCALNLGRNHLCVFDEQHNQWSSFFPRREQLRLRIWVFTLFDGFPVAW